MKATLVMGANNNPQKYACRAVKSLVSKGHKVIPFGRQEGSIDGLPIENDWNTTWDVDTVTLYLNPMNQRDYYEPIIGLKPRRVIFNPGTENHEFTTMLREAGIAYEYACTLVMLAIGEY